MAVSGHKTTNRYGKNFCREKQSYDYLKNAHTKAEILLDHDMTFRMDGTLFEEDLRFCKKDMQCIKNFVSKLRKEYKQSSVGGGYEKRL